MGIISFKPVIYFGYFYLIFWKYIFKCYKRQI